MTLGAGRLAPTAVNDQPYRIIVLDTPDNLEKVWQFTTFDYDEYLASLAQECIDKKKQHMTCFYDSPTAVLVCYDNTVCWKRPSDGKDSGEMDATIVSVHMMLLVGYADDYSGAKANMHNKRYDISHTVFYNEYKNN